MFRTGFRALVPLPVSSALSAGTAHAQTLVWSDDLDGSSISFTNWEHMTDSPRNYFVSGGYLHIVSERAQKEPC